MYSEVSGRPEVVTLGDGTTYIEDKYCITYKACSSTYSSV